MSDAELVKENQALREELRKQWESNHVEHCREWPHSGYCMWPLPAILAAHEVFTSTS